MDRQRLISYQNITDRVSVCLSALSVGHGLLRKGVRSYTATLLSNIKMNLNCAVAPLWRRLRDPQWPTERSLKGAR